MMRWILCKMQRILRFWQFRLHTIEHLYNDHLDCSWTYEDTGNYNWGMICKRNLKDRNFGFNFTVSNNVLEYLVFTTSTGEATRVAVNPATTAAEKWHDIPSSRRPLLRIASFATSYTTISPTFMMQLRATLGNVPVW